MNNKVFRKIFYNNLTVRELARKLKISSATASKYVKKLYLENIINIDVVGNVHHLSPNLSNKLCNFFLMASEIEFTLDNLRKNDALQQEKLSEISLIYGSKASNYSSDLSDTDILNTTKKELEKLIEKPIGKAIMRNHIVLNGFELFVEEAIKWRRLFGVLG